MDNLEAGGSEVLVFTPRFAETPSSFFVSSDFLTQTDRTWQLNMCSVGISGSKLFDQRQSGGVGLFP